MLHLRRLIWFIAKRLVVLCIVCSLIVSGFYMCLNTANIYVILTEGLQKRADVILTREKPEELNFYFHADFLSGDKALEGAFDGTSAYVDYSIIGFEYDLEIESLWAWPWDKYATCTVIERVPRIRGTVIPSRRNEVSERLPQWQGGRYKITLIKQAGEWKIIGMQQKTVIMEATVSQGN